jgi:hypothetical protein
MLTILHLNDGEDQPNHRLFDNNLYCQSFC